jgi:hypothetical protein
MISFRTILFLWGCLIFMALQSCSIHGAKQAYLSDCDQDITFKRVAYTHLIESLTYYDKKYIEVSGTYQQDKHMSALFNDSTLVKVNGNAFWVNFSPDCPLYLTGTHVGFFDYNKGGFIRINNKTIRIRGRLDLHNKGYLKQYKGCIDHVSFIEI